MEVFIENIFLRKWISPNFVGKGEGYGTQSQKEKADITCVSNVMKGRQMGEEKDALGAQESTKSYGFSSKQGLRLHKRSDEG